MDIKGFPALIVGVVVALVLAGAVLPVFAETTSAETTFKNDGYFRMNKVTDGNFTFSWDYDNPTEINVNDETIEYSNTNGLEISVVCSEAFYLRIRNNNASFIYNGPGGNIVADSTGETLTVSIVDNSGTVTNGTDSTTFTNVGEIYHISETGDYSMKKSNETAYMNGDSPIFIRGVSRIGTNYVSFVVSGDVDTGPTILGSNTTITDDSLNAVAVDSYIDLYEFSSVTFNATYTGDSTPTAVTYSYVVVPYEVTAEKAVHPDGPLTVLLNVLPLLAIAGLVTGAVVWFINRKG